ncbi:MAG: heat-inducible transcription repressor HrcA [Candidatus Zixiibacteriota bacterium]|nr:MAG: heat-inducible transcription repressor HrcA [candidate division Zixibacteria bacterium]HDL03620.1 heat-inducible transcription repressor HrcA [candidate division Zixibacteria bacterium]
MSFENLSNREKKVLQNLINHYIQTADPVGSRVIANKYRMGLSPATIRNTLQDLEEMGLLQQPHTSAGRIPTDHGYRVFVDMLLKQEPLNAGDTEKIQSMIKSSQKGIGMVLSQTSKILGDITNQLGVSISPRFEEGRLARLDLIPVSGGKLLVIVTVESGLARSILIEIESDIDSKELSHMQNVLNERLSGLTLGQIRKTIQKRLKDTDCTPRLIKLFIDPEIDIWTLEENENMFIMGTDNLVNQPEFSDRSRLSEFMKFLEEKKALKELIESKSIGEGIVITIGSECSIDQIQDCSLVTSKYRAGNLSGSIGIIGPTRMPYSKLISIVEYTAQSLTKALTESRGEDE